MLQIIKNCSFSILVLASNLLVAQNFDYLPPQYLTPSKVNEYKSDSLNHLYFENLKLRADCRFINEYQYGNGIINRYIGTYYVSDDTLFFVYDDTIKRNEKTNIGFTAVPFQTNKPAIFLIKKNEKLYYPKIKIVKRKFRSFKERIHHLYYRIKFKKRTKNNFTATKSLEFNICDCK